MFVQVYDPDLNLDINVPEAAQVEVWSELETIPETLTLTEIEADTGLFKGWMTFDDQTGFAMTDGVLQVDQGNQVWVQYTDVVDDWNNNNVISIDSALYDFRIREYEPDSNTVLLFHFNEGDGQVVYDASSNGNNGTFGYNNTSESEDPLWVDGLSQAALEFDGYYDFVGTNIHDSVPMTFEAWIYVESYNTNQPARQVIIGANQPGIDGLDISIESTFNDGRHYLKRSIYEIKEKNWYHIAQTWDTDSTRLYVNGIKVGSFGPETSSENELIAIGRAAVHNGGYAFNGIIDEVRISNIARTSFDYEYTANPPGKVNDLNIADSTSLSITLQWHAPGADNYTGTATIYDLRQSTSPIDSANFAQATAVSGLTSPASAGTIQSMTIDNLNYGTTYYFALKTQDDEGLWSPISNIAVGHTEPQDVTPPGTITDLAVATPGKREMIITWTAPADDGQSGRPVQGYSVHYSRNPITEDNFFSTDSVSPAPQSAITPGATITDTIPNLDPNTTYYLAVKSYDEVPNWSAISNLAQGTTAAVPVVAATPFPQNGYDAQRSRFLPRLGATQGTFRWSYATGGAVASSPVIDNSGNVYFGSEDGHVYALNSAGNLLWSKALGAGVFAAPCIGTE
ncbi:MAG: LamG-like jellyroll fold domain-containing protein, partial [Fidelibacterota bacterium]